MAADSAATRPSAAASRSDNPRFWPVVHAWAVGRLTNREFVREQLRTVGFIWIQPEAAS